MSITKWVIDPAHSEIQFKVKHLMLTTVTGHFRKFDLKVDTEGDDFTKASSLVFTADINSVDTNSEQRDGHVKSADFFAADQFPQLKFAGKGLEKKGDKYLLTGDLTIRDVTKPVNLDVEFGGIVRFTVEGKIKRKDFNLVWDAVTDAGHVVASNEVRILCEVQLIKQAVPMTADTRQEKAATA